jgi:hypothetical protein
MADLREIVGAHQPDEMLAREKRLERRDGIRGVMRAELRLEIEHADAWVARDGSGLLQALGEGRHAGDGLQRILRRDQPPYLVEPKPLQGFEADMAMALMGRVERAAEKTDPPLRQMAEHRPMEALRALPQGRTWPVPRTTYL